MKTEEKTTEELQREFLKIQIEKQKTINKYKKVRNILLIMMILFTLSMIIIPFLL